MNLRERYCICDIDIFFNNTVFNVIVLLKYFVHQKENKFFYLIFIKLKIEVCYADANCDHSLWSSENQKWTKIRIFYFVHFQPNIFVNVLLHCMQNYNMSEVYGIFKDFQSQVESILIACILSRNIERD